LAQFWPTPPFLSLSRYQVGPSCHPHLRPNPSPSTSTARGCTPAPLAVGPHTEAVVDGEIPST
jgi:hypothetical protein